MSWKSNVKLCLTKGHAVEKVEEPAGFHVFVYFAVINKEISTSE